MNELSVGQGEPFGPLVEPLKKVNRLVVAQVDKGVTLGWESLKAYVDLGMSQIKVALKVTDPHGLHEFADSQFAVASFVGHRMLDDSRAVNEWMINSYNQANCLARANLLKLLFKH